MPAAKTTKKSTRTSGNGTRAKKASAKKAGAKKATKKAPAKKSAATRAKMAQSQQARRAISNYLDALHAPKRRGRQVSPETLKQRLREAQAAAAKAIGIARLDAMKAVHELEQRVKSTGSTAAKDMKALEAAFVKYARGYAERKDIPHHVWRRAGVPASVLQRAGIKRSAD